MLAGCVAAPIFASRELRLSWGNSQLGLSLATPKQTSCFLRPQAPWTGVSGSLGIQLAATLGECGWVSGHFLGGRWAVSCTGQAGQLGLLRQKSFLAGFHFHSWNSLPSCPHLVPRGWGQDAASQKGLLESSQEKLGNVWSKAAAVRALSSTLGVFPPQ